LFKFFEFVLKGMARGNGCSLTDEQLEQRRAEKRKAKKKVKYVLLFMVLYFSTLFKFPCNLLN